MLSNSGITTVGKWARLTIAKTSDVVWVSTKVLGGSSTSRKGQDQLLKGRSVKVCSILLDFVGTKVLIDHLPDNFVGLHIEKRGILYAGRYW